MGKSVVAKGTKGSGSSTASGEASSKDSKSSDAAKDESKGSNDAKDDSESSHKESDKSSDSKKSDGQDSKRSGDKSAAQNTGAGDTSCVWRCFFGGGQSSDGASSSNGGSASSGGQGGSQESNYVTVTVSVTSSAVGNPVSSGCTFTFNEGATVYDALCALGLSVNAHGSSYGTYVSAIGGLAEKQVRRHERVDVLRQRHNAHDGL